MFPASTKGGGNCLGVPDVCLTPAPPSPSPVPVPYPNTAQCTDAIVPCMKVLIENKEVIVKGTKIPMSSGDESGSAGGVTSGMIKGPVEFKMGSFKVKVMGKEVCHLTSMSGHNGSGSQNQPAAGLQVAPSQVKVIVMM
jgi:hypothetical protein